MFIIKKMGDLKEIPTIFDNKMFRPVFELARFKNLTNEGKMEYFEKIAHARDLVNQMDYCKSIGKEKGLRKGRLEGKLEGEEKKTIEVVANLFY